MKNVHPDLAPLQQLAGKELGVSEWLVIDQDKITAFAEVSGDHQYIHLDKQRAAAEFGDTIAHGLLTLALVVPLVLPLIKPYVGDRTLINYGINALRFLAPVRCNSRIRTRSRLIDIAQKQNARSLLTIAVVVEIDGSEQPALVGELLVLVL